MTIHKHQMDRPSHGGAPCGARSVYPLAADEAQGGRRVPSVGEIVQGTGSLARLLTLLPNSRGRIAICAPRFSNHRIASRHPLSGRGYGRAGRTLLPRLARTQFMRSVMALRSQFGLPEHVRRQTADAPECHSLSPFHGVTFHIQEHATKGVGSAQDHIGEIQYAAYC